MRISTLLATVGAVAAASGIGVLATGPAVRSSWYENLRKPPYQPPRQVFPIVWPALYADVALVSAHVIDRLSDTGQVRQRRAYQAALAINLVLNASWSWLFFNQRRYRSSTVLSGVLTASGADLAHRAIRAGGSHAVPLAAYPLWCAFATVLSGHIALLNLQRS